MLLLIGQFIKIITATQVVLIFGRKSLSAVSALIGCGHEKPLLIKRGQLPVETNNDLKGEAVSTPFSNSLFKLKSILRFTLYRPTLLIRKQLTPNPIKWS